MFVSIARAFYVGSTNVESREVDVDSDDSTAYASEIEIYNTERIITADKS